VAARQNNHAERKKPVHYFLDGSKVIAQFVLLIESKVYINMTSGMWLSTNFTAESGCHLYTRRYLVVPV